MPASPKLGYRARDIRVVEVFNKFKAEYLAESECHIRVSAEIKINLEGVCESASPCADNGDITSKRS